MKRNLFGFFGLLVLAGLAVAILWRQPVQPIEGHLLDGIKSIAGDFQYVEDTPFYNILALYPAATPIKDPVLDARVRREVEQYVLDRINEFKAEYANRAPVGYTPLLEVLYTQTLSSKTFSYIYEIRVEEDRRAVKDTFESLVFDNEGHRLTLSDVFVPGSGYLGIISREATGLLQQQLDQLAREQSASFRLIPAGLTPKPENFRGFALNGTRLLIIFPAGQVADKEAGPLTVDLPLEPKSALSDIVRPSILEF